MRRRRGGRGNGRRFLAAVTLLPAILSTSGCLGLKEDPKLDTSLRRYRGEGFSVGYPKAWARSASDRRAVPGSLFEVTTAAGSFDILTYWGRAQLLDDVVSDFLRISRAQRGFQLIGQERIDVDGSTGYRVRKECNGCIGTSSQRLHTVDWFAQLKNGTVVDVRIGFLTGHYDFSIVTSIGRSLAVD
jgi:hypothetical protein